ncbi:MAG TPA: S8 family serine peptidase [Bacteroidales bacterium]|nr:S8 family serine peptidase [Bacteroidales bacterium]
MKRKLLSFLPLVFACLPLHSQNNHPQADQLVDHLRQKQELQAGRVRAYVQATGATERKDEDGRTWQLMDVRDGKPFYYITHNLDAANVHKVSQVWPGGSTGFNLSGSGVNLGIWDGGKVRDTHQEFFDGVTYRVTQVDGATSLSDHATHVAGTLAAAGTNASAKGMSYAAMLKAYDWDFDETEMAAAASGGLRVSQHSYGYVTGWAYGSWSGNTGWHWFGDAAVSATEDYSWGFYSDQAKDWDQIAFNAPNYLIVKSAGNDRGEGPAPSSLHYFMNPSNAYNWEASTVTRSVDGGSTGYDCIAHSATSKNILTVGAVTNTGVMSSFSGWGPTDDGRIKPDIVAKGVNVYSSIATSNTSYQSYNGTSMAGPVVSGSVGLLLQHQQNLHPGTPLRAATIKGLLIHSADDMVSGSPGPDYRFGWGMLDVQKAAQIMADNATTNAHIRELVLNNAQTMRFPVQTTGTEPLRITISWTDVPGTSPSPSLNPTTTMLVNDLDVRLKDAYGNQYFPYILNPSSPGSAATTGDNNRDNVEMIHLSSTTAGTIYFLEISHKGSLVGGSQAFSLIITGNQPLDERNILGSFDQGAYYLSWSNASNQGEGFGPWELVNGTASGGFSGFFIGDPAAAGISGMSNQSFGLFANPDNASNFARADRAFAAPLPTGSTLSFKWGVNWDSDGIGNKGFNLYSNGTQIINVNMGGSAQITINGNPMFNNYGTQAMTLSFKAESPTQLRVSGTGRDGSEIYNVVHTVAGPPDAVRFYASGLKSGDQRQPYFDQLTITSDPAVYSSSETVTVKGSVGLSSSLSVKNIIIEGDNRLIIPQGINATVSTHLYNSAGADKLVIQSNASGSGSLLHYNQINGTMQRYVPGSTLSTGTRYHLVSVPLKPSANPVSGLFSGSYLFRFDADPGSWVGLGTSTTTPLQVDRGYMIWYTGSQTTYNFAGPLNNGNFTALVASTAADRFNLVPNPYPSAIDWDAASGWTKTNLYNAIYIWNRNTGNYASYVSGVGANGGSRYIAPGQSFFVKTTAASAGLQMGDAVRVHNAQPFFQPQLNSHIIRISTSNEQGSDETVIRFNAQASDEFDPDLDADKIIGQQAAPQLFTTLEDGRIMSINSLNDDFKQLTVPVSFASATPGSYTLSFSIAPPLQETYHFVLEDLLLNLYHNLSDNADYTFSHQANASQQRFLLHATGITGLGQLNSDDIRVRKHGQRLNIHRTENTEPVTIRLFDVSGRIMAEMQSAETFISIPLHGFKGLVLVEMTGKQMRTHKKIVF